MLFNFFSLKKDGTQLFAPFQLLNSQHTMTTDILINKYSGNLEFQWSGKLHIAFTLSLM